MSGHCLDCGNVMCLCDSEGDEPQGVVMSGVMISDERYKEFKSFESTISQQAEIIKILSEACERISSGTYNSEVRMAIDALAQVEKLKGE